MTGGNDLARMVPGFEFLQNLMKGAGAGIPGMGQWIAPTLDPKELEKRIEDLKTVQFWLEQNSRLIGTTVQALEVQRMTLATLQTMNLPLTDLREALKVRPAAAEPAPPEPELEPEPEARPATAPPAPAPAVDPMHWWGALTQQFTEIAAKAMKDSAADAARSLAAATAGAAAEPAAKKAAPRRAAAKTGKSAAAAKADQAAKPAATAKADQAAVASAPAAAAPGAVPRKRGR